MAMFVAGMVSIPRAQIQGASAWSPRWAASRAEDMRRHRCGQGARPEVEPPARINGEPGAANGGEGVPGGVTPTGDGWPDDVDRPLQPGQSPVVGADVLIESQLAVRAQHPKELAVTTLASIGSPTSWSALPWRWSS